MSPSCGAPPITVVVQPAKTGRTRACRGSSCGQVRAPFADEGERRHERWLTASGDARFVVVMTRADR